MVKLFLRREALSVVDLLSLPVLFCVSKPAKLIEAVPWPIHKHDDLIRLVTGVPGFRVSRPCGTSNQRNDAACPAAVTAGYTVVTDIKLVEKAVTAAHVHDGFVVTGR